MISFKHNEIPNGRSKQSLDIQPKDLGLDDLEVKKMRLNVRFDKSEDSTVIDFDFEAVMIFVCDRSLEKFDQVLTGSFKIVYKANIESEEETEEGTFKKIQYGGDILDITKEVRDTIMLSVPIKKLHPRYIDEEGQPTDFERSYSSGETTDPRWEALKKLKDKNNNNEQY